MVMDFFLGLNPVYQALIGGLFGWFMTMVGASAVFFGKKFNRKIFDWSLGFAAGVMIAASIWSLLLPAIAMSNSESSGFPLWFAPALGFLLGAIALRGVDKILPHLHVGAKESQREGVKTSWHKSILMILGITMHNIPEGLAVGVAFGAVASGVESATIIAAIALAIGIGIQNLPEGLSVGMPLRGLGYSRKKSFFYGQISGIVEPVAAVIGALAVVLFTPILPYALAFAAGAMIFVVIEEAIPESHNGGNSDLATMGTIIGFVVMMVLDVALG